MKYTFKPPTDNVIFYDSEFSTGDPYKGELLSIGLVKIDGEELYLELEHDGYVEPWVKKNILPTLKGNGMSRKKAIKLIKEFVGETEPYVVAYVNIFDMVYTHKFFGTKNINDLPFYWIPIDFASILFSIGINPISYKIDDKENFFKKIGIDASKYVLHNALDDAKLLRDVYLKMVE